MSKGKKIFLIIILLLVLIFAAYKNLYIPGIRFTESQYSCNTSIIAPDIECLDVPRYEYVCKGFGFTVFDQKLSDLNNRVNLCIGFIKKESL
jgi:hypothetical protein